MQTKNHKKKGFTLVELIVVIVVIAILTAILIPTIGYVIEHSKETADITTVKLLNLALVEDNAKNDAPETMTDVIKIMKSKGYLIDKITPRSSGDILWDSANNRFMLKKDDKVLYQDKSTVKAESYELWKVVETEKDGKVIENLQPVLKSDSYSHYLKGENFAQSLTVSTGLDVGENANIPSVSYNGNTKAQKVTIRTQGGTLSIDAETDTVNHYGWVKELAVTAVAKSDCYHEHGFVGKLVTFSSGRFIAAKGTIFHETKKEIETIIGSNEKELTKAKFGGHYYNANGVCVMEDCTGNDGHRATNDKHVHKYDENGVCECGATKAGVKKDGLVNGYYYKDDELFTGETDGYEFRNGILVVKSKNSCTEANTYNIIHSFNESDIDSNYLTDKIILITNSSIYGSPGLQSYVRNYLQIEFSNYSITNAKAYSPALNDLLSATPWTESTLENYLNMLNGTFNILDDTCGNTEYEDINALPYYIQGKDWTDYNALNASYISFAEYLKFKYRNNVIITDESTAISAYFVKEGTTEKISAYAYKNNTQGIGLVISSDGKVYAYAWTENESCYPVYTELKDGENSLTNNSSNIKYIIDVNGNSYTIKYNGEKVVTLECTISTISNYNLSVEKENLKGISLFNECTQDELLALATMPGKQQELTIKDNLEVAELFLKAFWNQYYLRIVDSNANKTKCELTDFDKNSLENMSYYIVYFSNGIANAYQNMQHVGPIIEIELTKNNI